MRPNHQHPIKARASDLIRSLNGQLALIYDLMSSPDPHPLYRGDRIPIYNSARAKAIRDINLILDNYHPEELTDAEYKHIMSTRRYLLTAYEDMDGLDPHSGGDFLALDR